jgi:16S rRNA (uracil1498-N3)-methyltransferase
LSRLSRGETPGARCSHNHSVVPRFHAPAARAGDVISLPEEEGRHLTRVLRLQTGDALAVFDGHGAEFHAVVERVGSHGVDVRVGAAKAPAAEPRVAVTLVQAVLKGEKMDDVVRDAVMMGVAAIQPAVTARTEISRATIERGRRQERWQRIAIASAKQCGRAVVPAVLAPLDAGMLPAAITAGTLPAPAFMLVEPSASGERVALRDLDPSPPPHATVLVGPEGGWTTAEIAAASGPCRLVTMGARTIRADAMATIAIAALFTKWGEL